jgi:hypothetical protein
MKSIINILIVSWSGTVSIQVRLKSKWHHNGKKFRESWIQQGTAIENGQEVLKNTAQEWNKDSNSRCLIWSHSKSRRDTENASLLSRVWYESFFLRQIYLCSPGILSVKYDRENKIPGLATENCECWKATHLMPWKEWWILQKFSETTTPANARNFGCQFCRLSRF